MLKSKVFVFFKWHLLMLSFVAILFNSCKKTEQITPSFPDGVESDFFKESASAGDLINRLANNLKEHNATRHFVKDIAHQEGMPVWNKTLSETKNNTTVVLLPLVPKNKKFVNSFILFKIKGEQITSQLVQGGNYDKYTYAADLVAIKFMELNTAVFGSTDFVATNKNVFNIGAVEAKLGKGPLQLKLTTHDNAINARPQPGSITTIEQALTATGTTGTTTSTLVVRRCTGVVYMQSGTITSTSGDLSCGPTIIDITPGTPITPIPATPTTPTTPPPTGGGDPSPGLPPPVKPILNEDFCIDASDLQSMTCTVTPNSSSTSGTISTSSLGEITIPKSSKGCTYTFNCLWYHPSWNTYYTGVAYKINKNDLIWKWKNFAFSGFNRSGGTMPPSMTADASATVSTTIASDKRYATGEGSVRVTFSSGCLGFEVDVTTFNKSVYDTFYSNI